MSKKETYAELAKKVKALEKTESALRESEKLYRSLFENAPIGIGIADRNGNLSGTDNELGPMQPSLYGHQDLYVAGVIPEYNRGDPNQVNLVIDWHAEKLVYPMWGGVLRYRGEVWMPNPGVEDYVGTLGRSSGDCKVINKVYK